ncbi:MAG: hypothetical protein ABGY41_05165 [Candidatus Poribacteria bacterium]
MHAAGDAVCPGEDFRSWQAAEPRRNPAVPTSYASASLGGPAVAIASSPYGIPKTPDAVYGEVALELRVRVDAGPANSQIGFMLGGSTSGQSPVWKDEADTWRWADYTGRLSTGQDLRAIEVERRHVRAV